MNSTQSGVAPAGASAAAAPRAVIDYDFQSVLAAPPKQRLVLWLLAGVLAALALGLAVAKVDMVVAANGKIITSDSQIVVQPLGRVGGKPAPLGGLATASVIQYDRSNPSAADWFDVSLREDGAWLHKSPDGSAPGNGFTDKDMRGLLEWLVS